MAIFLILFIDALSRVSLVKRPSVEWLSAGLVYVLFYWSAFSTLAMFDGTHSDSISSKVTVTSIFRNDGIIGLLSWSHL